MLIVPQKNSFQFANMSVTLTDNTGIVDDTVTPTPEVPRFNFLIPTVQDVGVTNQMELYFPGELNRYTTAHGKPNAMKYGFGPDFIMGILANIQSNVGVYTINLRGKSATIANVICKMMYKVEKDVPYTDTEGNPYYVDPETGELTIEPTDNPVIRDVLNVRYMIDTAPDVKKWTDFHNYMNSLYSDVEDDAGYKVMPMFGVMYRGATAFANNAYFSLIPYNAEFDQNVYYRIHMFDGVSMIKSDLATSFEPSSGEKYGQNYYIENQFNATFPTFRYMTADYAQDMLDLFNRYMYTVEDFIAGTMDTPANTLESVDIFSVERFGIMVEADSLNSKISNAFPLSGGSDGTETPDELYEMFYRGEIITDISSQLRYRINYIPDIGYNDATKQEILDLVERRTNTTVTSLMVGGIDSFASAMIEHQSMYYKDSPCMRQLAKVQSPMMYNEYIKRTITYPGSYFDTMALVKHFAITGNYYAPFAGADARWEGFIEDTMAYPTETTDFIGSLYRNRVNVVMKDARPGAYLADQQMNVVQVSDQMELNNAFLISNMLYDLINLVHYNHFKFNELDEVRLFSQAVDEKINSVYAPYSASLSVTVSRVGTRGAAKSKNVITVRIDLRDIQKYTDVEIFLEEE